MNIQFRDVSKWFGTRRALTLPHLRLQSDELFVIAGPNGAGKSVLLKLLAGILSPTKGIILWDGDPIQDNLLTYKFRIGYMPQQPMFYEEQTVTKCLYYFGRLKAIPTRMLGPRVSAIIDQMNLIHLARRPIKHLSGGERSRLALGVALLNDPDVLLLDEPGANLDPQERLDLWSLVGELRHGRTIGLATHIYDGLEEVVDRMLLLDEGCLIEDAAVKSLLAEVAPYVWTVADASDIAPGVGGQSVVAGLRRTQSSSQWRVLASERPTPAAVNVPATLEDAYLWVRWQVREQASFDSKQRNC